MKNQTLLGYAFLKVNLEHSKNHDYIQNFVSLVAECIRMSSIVNTSGVITAPDIQAELMDRFGLYIPLKAVDSLLHRVSKVGYIIQNPANVYEPVWEKLETLHFKEVQQEVIRMHDSVIQELLDFSHKRFELDWTVDDAENALYQFLDDTEIILSQHAYRRSESAIERQPDRLKYVVGQFVLHLHNTHSGNLEFFETIVKGSMLASAIYLPEPSSRRKFQHTDVYFDTAFLIYALGYSGKARQDPCAELIDMLYDVGGQAFCFEHTVDEIRNALYACSIIIDEHRTPLGPSVETVQHFVSMGCTGTDVRIKADKLEIELKRIRVHIKKKPDYIPSEYKHVPAEAELAKWLSERVFNSNVDDTLIDRDVASISAIKRLRREVETIHIEICRAVFVTTNSKLSREVKAFFDADNNDRKYAPSVPPCISDYELAVLLWLKSPLKAPSLPRKRLIADTYAAIQPSERLWQAYIREIERLRAQGEVDRDDAYLLRYTSTATSFLMDVTYGQEAAFTQATVHEVLKKIHDEYARDFEARITVVAEKERAEKAALDEARQTAEMLARRLKQENRARLDKMELRATRWTRNVFLSAKIGLVVVSFVAMGAQTLADANDITTFVREHRLSALSANCIMLSALLTLFLTTLFYTAKQVLSNSEPSRIQEWISKRLFRIFLNVAAMSDESDVAHSNEVD